MKIQEPLYLQLYPGGADYQDYHQPFYCTLWFYNLSLYLLELQHGPEAPVVFQGAYGLALLADYHPCIETPTAESF